MARPRKLQESLRYSAVGIEVGLSVIVGLIAGTFADDYFETSPWLSLAGLLVGVAAGFRSLMRAAKRMRDESRDPPDSSNSPGPSS